MAGRTAGQLNGDVPSAVAERVARASYGQLVALLTTLTRDITLAEDALADAFERALRTWPATGVPDNPQGWLVLTLAQSRAPARTSMPWPPLGEQDTALWDRSLIAEGEALLRRAHALGAPLGRFQLEAAIQSAHCDRVRTGTVDRAALVKLYRGLVAIAPTTGARQALKALTPQP